MSTPTKLFALLCAVALVGCGSEPASSGPQAAGGSSGRQASQSAGGSSGGVRASAAGNGGSSVGGSRSALACPPRSDAEVKCGGETCPTSTKYEDDPCFVPCCVTFEGKERCGFRGTSRLTTQCVLPAVADPSCNDAPQFFGCCEQTRHVCGIIAGVLPGCQTKVSFATLPQPPKACGLNAGEDAGTADAG